VIVQILGENCYRVDDTQRSAIAQLDEDLLEALDKKNHARFHSLFEQLLARIRQYGQQLSENELNNELVLPDPIILAPDMTVAEAKKAIRPEASRWRQFIQTEWAVALLVLVISGLFVIGFLELSGDPREFIQIGSNFIDRVGPSDVIRPDPATAYPTIGYDGQFCYYIALDPVNAHYYIDDPAWVCQPFCVNSR